MKNNVIKTMTALMFIGLTIASCSKENAETTSDADLITAIDSAKGKQQVPESSLPAETSGVLNSEFSEYFVTSAEMATELGYKVVARMDDPSLFDEGKYLYFDLNGRRLIDPDRPHDARRDWCFRLVYPFTVTLANGNVVEIENFQQLKRVAKSCDFRPCFEINYPIQINIGDRLITINSNGQLRCAFIRCDRNETDRIDDCARD